MPVQSTAVLPTATTGVVCEKPLTSRDAAPILRKNHKTLEKYARQGIIPAHFRLNRWYFFESELVRWLKADVDSACQPLSRELGGL